MAASFNLAHDYWELASGCELFPAMTASVVVLFCGEGGRRRRHTSSLPYMTIFFLAVIVTVITQCFVRALRLTCTQVIFKTKTQSVFVLFRSEAFCLEWFCCLVGWNFAEGFEPVLETIIVMSRLMRFKPDRGGGSDCVINFVLKEMCKFLLISRTYIIFTTVQYFSGYLTIYLI